MAWLSDRMTQMIVGDIQLQAWRTADITAKCCWAANDEEEGASTTPASAEDCQGEHFVS